MSVKLSTQRKIGLSHIIRALGVAALVLALTGILQIPNVVQAQSPRFVVFPEWEFFDGLDWPDGAEVSISVAGKPECDLTRTSWGGFFNGNFPEGCDVATGDTVTFSDGDTPREHVVRTLAITAVDKVSDTISGIADAGETVYVWPHDGWFDPLEVTADASGGWGVDLSSAGYDILEGAAGRSEIRDEFGNATAVDWYVPNPRFVVFPEWEFFDGLDWPDGAEVSISVAGKDICDLTRTSWGGFFNGNFPEGCDVQTGDTVTFADGETTREHVVRNLSVTAADKHTDTITGIADAGEVVYVWPHDGGFEPLQATADEFGGWQVDLSIAGYDIVEESTGRSEIRDEFGNATAVDWYVPPPITGFHDYDYGDVPDWACNVGGWAIDPDEPYTDINVRILVDGSQMMDEIVAGNYREDLEQAWNEGWGGCPEGTCAFEVSLWDYITRYETHEVAVEAQDLESGEWYLLNESPKSLTCRTYDIYIFDTLTGETRQVSNLLESGEYNPSWSPDGRWIAHDMVAGNTHDIYLTDVKSGSSKPLVGAEGGNDAVWSPNGRWIAFDRQYASDPDPSLYILPATGGVRRLVRTEATSPTWAPNSLRLAFQDKSDGAIRTADLYGGSLTTVAEYGEYPRWSPNGKWIAFDLNGDIWKVGVDILGRPQGDPIQLTFDVDLSEGSATWSNDNKTIVYQAGYDRDFNIWMVPADGGTPALITGAPQFGDYNPAFSSNGRSIAYASFAPLPQPPPQSARLWVAAFTYDLPAGTWTEGEHAYHFEFEWSLPEPGMFSGQGGDMFVTSEADIYDGFVLLRGPRELHRVVFPGGPTCEETEAIHPGQPTRFLVGWLPDYGEMTYPQARTHFESIIARVVWDDGMVGNLIRHEIRPYSPEDVDKWFDYVCTYTVRE